MIQERNNWLWYKFNGLLRWGMVHEIIPPFNNIVLTEYPKSGGTWISQMIAEALNIPFPRNRLPMLTRQLLHGHYLMKWNIKKPIVLFRDGRDVVISLYFHLLIPNGKNEANVNKHRKYFKVYDYEDVKTNLVQFIEYVNNTRYHHFTWSQFVNNWVNYEKAIFTSYENFRKNPIKELIKVVSQYGVMLDEETARLIVDKFSFERLTKRKAGEEDRKSFLRKGIIGDWKNYFNEESRELFKYYSGNELIKLGYEKNNEW